MPKGSLAHRIRSLPVEGLRQLLDYEQEHSNRLPATASLRRPQTARFADGSSVISFHGGERSGSIAMSWLRIGGYGVDGSLMTDDQSASTLVGHG